MAPEARIAAGGAIRNRLVARDTGWRWWYALPAWAGIVAAGMLPGLVIGGTGAGTATWVSATNMALVGILPLAIVILLARRIPSRAEIGFEFRGLGRQLLVAFAVIAAYNAFLFGLQYLVYGTIGDLRSAEIGAFGLGRNLAGDLLQMTLLVVAAPVCEELAYRVAIFRPLHDGLRSWQAGFLRFARLAVSLLAAAVVFTLPHSEPGNPQFWSFMLLALLFPLVYLVTGSLVAAIMAHSFQSSWAWGMLLYLSRGDAPFSSLLYAFVLASPLFCLGITWLVSRLFPR